MPERNPRRGGVLAERLHQYALLMRWHRPAGGLLLLWPTLWGLWISGDGSPDPLTVLIFVIGVFTMRSAGCVINDIADRNFDLHVKRTRERPLTAGAVSTREALMVFAAGVAVSAALLLALNWLTFQLACAGLVIAVIYPFLKRYTYFPQLFLGIAFGWGIPMAFAAQTNTVPPLAWLLFIGNILFSIIYDTQYAMVDRDDDLKLGLKSTAILFEDSDRRILAILQALMIITLMFVGARAELGVPFHFGLFVVALLFVYQQVLIRDREREACFAAFKNNNWVGFVIFSGLVLDYLVV